MSIGTVSGDFVQVLLLFIYENTRNPTKTHGIPRKYMESQKTVTSSHDLKSKFDYIKIVPETNGERLFTWVSIFRVTTFVK